MSKIKKTKGKEMRYKAQDEGKDKQAIKKDIWTSIYKKHPKPLPQ